MGIFESKPIDTVNKQRYIKKNIDNLFKRPLEVDTMLSDTMQWNNLTFTENSIKGQLGGSQRRYLNYLPKDFIPKYRTFLQGGNFGNTLSNQNNNNLSIYSVNTESVNELNSINNKLNQLENQLGSLNIKNNNSLLNTTLSETSNAHMNSVNNLPFSATSNSHLTSINNMSNQHSLSAKSLDMNSLTSDFINGANISFNYSDNDVNQVNKLKDIIKSQLGGCGCSTTSSIPELKGGDISSTSESSKQEKETESSESSSDSMSDSEESEVEKMTKDGTTESSDSSDNSDNSDNSSSSSNNNTSMTGGSNISSQSENINVKPFYSTEDASEYFNKMKKKKL